MHPNPRRIVPILLIIALVAAGAWWFSTNSERAASALSASGTIEITQIHVAAEAAGRVTSVAADEGESVSGGTVVVTFDDALLQTQREQALATLAAAEANHAAAAAALAAAEAQYDQVRAGAREQEIIAQEQAVAAAQSGITTAETQIEQARSVLASAVAQRDQAAARLEQVEGGPRSEELEAAQAQMKKAEAAVTLAQSEYDKIKWNSSIVASPQALALEEATLNLHVAQANYDALAKGATTPERDQARAAVAQATAGMNQAAAGVSQAEAALQAAKAKLGAEQARLDLLNAGARPEQIDAAAAQVEAADAQVDAAAGQVEAARAAVATIDEQLAKLIVTAPADGTVLQRAIEPGEVAQPGGTLLVLGDLSRLYITVYVPEDEYGRIRLGQTAEVSADSFPGERFSATVERIADQAEFTPRNVQTAEGRKTTVFAIELAIDNPEAKLKPGMPADVKFEG